MKHLNVASEGKRAYVKKYAIVVLCAFTLPVIVLASAGRGTTKTEIGSSPAPTPPTVVTGTELRGNVATVKPGYRFVDRGRSVDVMNTRKFIITGTYVCPCNSNDPARRCDLVFSPTIIKCKSGSCSGSCLLSAAAPTMGQ